MDRETTIYVQWYPYKFKSGYCVESPTENELETFYKNVRVSDYYHESFVIIIDKRKVSRGTIHNYVMENVMPYFGGIWS